MKNRLSRADLVLDHLVGEMSESVYQNINIIGMPSPIFYDDADELVRFYQPDVMLRRGYLRLSGSVGFALADPAINGNISVGEALDPKNGCMISVRLENSHLLMDLGVVQSAEMVEIAPFVEKLIEYIKDNVPETVIDAKRMASDPETWVGILMQYYASVEAASPFRKVASVLLAHQ